MFINATIINWDIPVSIKKLAFFFLVLCEEVRKIGRVFFEECWVLVDISLNESEGLYQILNLSFSKHLRSEDMWAFFNHFFPRVSSDDIAIIYRKISNHTVPFLDDISSLRVYSPFNKLFNPTIRFRVASRSDIRSYSTSWSISRK